MIDMAREHANPIHFHVEENGRDIAKIKADGSVIDGELSKAAEELLEKPGTINKLRGAEDRITRTIRAKGERPGGRPFKPGERGEPKGGCSR